MARRSYTPEFKREAVRLAAKPGVSRRQVAKQLGIHPNVLASWQRNFEKGNWKLFYAFALLPTPKGMTGTLIRSRFAIVSADSQSC